MKVKELVKQLKGYDLDANVEVLLKEEELLYTINVVGVESGTKAEKLTSVVVLTTF